MSFFSWMRAARLSPGESPEPNEDKTVAASPVREVTTKSTYISMEPSAIAEAVILLREENARANELRAKADLVIKGQEYELARLRDTLQFQEQRSKDLEFSNSSSKIHAKNLQAAAKKLNSSLDQKSAQLSQTQYMLRLAQEKCNALQNEILQARLVARVVNHGDLYDDGETITDAVSLLTQHADLRPMPFVVILVDGDSYRFPHDNKASDTCGPDIAHNLHREVSKYILSHPQIPPHAKIVVRIFCNRSSMQGRIRKTPRATVKGNQPVPRTDADREPSQTVETMVKFAETYPLFDYLDCGGGKERVDDKIRENCHLYLADSSCHTVFLAVCNDNGYVRMLERYDGNPIPSAKIVLLTNGRITPEIAKLSFPKVELNGVFFKRYQSKRAQGSSGKMGPLLETSGLPGFQTASDYDLDHTDPHIQERIGDMLKHMQKEKQKSTAHPAIFVRLPYETDERYEERLRALLPFSRPNISYSRGFDRSVGFVGLRKVRPSGTMPTAPILPFLLRSETTESAYGQQSEGPEKSWVLEDMHHEMSWALD